MGKLQAHVASAKSLHRTSKHSLPAVRSKHVRPLRVIDTKTKERSDIAESNVEASEEPQTSGCPFLRSLTEPPPGHGSLLETLPLQFADSLAYQRKILGDQRMVKAQGLFPAVTMANPEVARYVLAKEHDQFQVGWPASVGLVLGQSSVISVLGERHRYLRQLLNPAFTMEQVASYIPAMTLISQKYLDKWAAQEGPVDVYQEMKSLTFLIIADVVLGLETSDEELKEMGNMFKVLLEGLFSPLAIEIPFTPFARAMSARRALKAKFQGIITELRRKLGGGHWSEPPKGVLAAMILAKDEQGNMLTDEEVIDNLFTLAFAGHDTSASLLTSMLYVLHEYPEVKQKLLEEQLQVMRDCPEGISDRSLRRMRYAEAFMWECLRLYTPVAAIFRKSIQDCELDGYLIKEQQRLMVPLLYLGLHNTKWSSMEGDMAEDKFNPDRFLQDDSQKTMASQLGFGWGARTCIGKNMAVTEMKVLLAVMTRGYELEYVGPSKLEWTSFPMRSPKGGLLMTCRPRHST